LSDVKQAQIGELSELVRKSSPPPINVIAPAIRIGIVHDQQMSLRKSGNLFGHKSAAVAGIKATDRTEAANHFFKKFTI
jgi:hypothetical protein